LNRVNTIVAINTRGLCRW